MNISMQTLRGLAIMAVVLTHAQFDPTQIQANYIIQNLINIGVAGFIFLSGYFTNQQKVKENPLSFIKHRFKRLIIPYIFWTVSYLAFSYIRGTRYSFEEIAREVLLGYGTLYFILVLFYLTLFTPFIVKFKDYKIINILFYAVTRYINILLLASIRDRASSFYRSTYADCLVYLLLFRHKDEELYPHILYQKLNYACMLGIRLGSDRNGNPVAFHQRHSICGHPLEIHTFCIHHIFYSHLYQKERSYHKTQCIE